jgi:hypothetical protein
MENQNFKSFLKKMFECYCLVTIQTQNFFPYFGHVTMYMYTFFFIRNINIYVYMYSLYVICTLIFLIKINND